MIELPQAELPSEGIPKPEPIPEEEPAIAEVEPTPESEQEPAAIPEPAPVPPPPQTGTEPWSMSLIRMAGMPRPQRGRSRRKYIRKRQQDWCDGIVSKLRRINKEIGRRSVLDAPADLFV